MVFLLLGSLAQACTFLLTSFLGGWQVGTLTFAVNTSGCTVSTASLHQAIDDALAVWNTVPTSGIRLVRGGSSSTSVATANSGAATDAPVILCDTGLSATIGTSANNIMASTTVIANSDRHIRYGFVLLNSEAGMNANIANVTQSQLAIGIGHEIGHVLGLGHSSASSSLMNSGIGSKTTLSLSADDVDGVSYLYPSGFFSACGTLTRRGPPGGGGIPPAEGPLNLALMVGIAYVGVMSLRFRKRAYS